MKLIKLYFLLVLSIFLCTGCYNKKELDNLAYVIAIGADVGSGEELEITYQIAIPLKFSSNDGKTGEENFTTYTVSAPSLYVGNSKVNALTSKEVNLSHVKLIVYSEELAKSNLSGHINSLISNVSIRPKTTVAICKNSAKDFLKNITPDLESSPARYYELLFTSQNHTNESAKSELIDFYTATSSMDRDSAVILLSNKKSGDESSSSGGAQGTSSDEKKSDDKGNESSGAEKEADSKGNETSKGNAVSGDENVETTGGNKSAGEKSEETKEKSDSSQSEKENSQKKFSGLAVFKGSKMVGEIPQELIISHLILTNELKKADITVDDAKEKGKTASIFLKQEKNCNFDVSIENDVPKINVTVKLTGHLRSSTSTTDYLQKENKELLTKKIESKIESLLQDYIRHTQTLNADTAGLRQIYQTSLSHLERLRKLQLAFKIPSRPNHH